MPSDAKALSDAELAGRVTARDLALEEAATVADKYQKALDAALDYGAMGNNAPRVVGERIRALKSDAASAIAARRAGGGK